MTFPELSDCASEAEESDGASSHDMFFDRIYPPAIRKASPWFWTPVVVARRAAELLVSRPLTRVLDIGAGPGKFCLIGAMITEGHFTGIEQRESLAIIAIRLAYEQGAQNIDIIHGNVVDFCFRSYDAFYFFNPFEEHLYHKGRLDLSVSASVTRYAEYTRHVSTQLAMSPNGTRLVTYAGYGHEVPQCYQEELSDFGGLLKLWIKTREAIPNEGTWGSRGLG